ncbi:MAG TPA: flavoprotein [Acidimicrobiales bacterium]|nr:flavoprotein [Acidimicrobiales bacterium]
MPAPAFPVRRVLLAGTGAIGVSMLPAWVFWVRHHLHLEARVALTCHAEALVSPKALAALSGHRVWCESGDVEPEIAHMEAVGWAEAILVVPATANVIGKLANGIADDLVTTIVAASRCPVVLVPSLTPAMQSKPATQRNLRQLAEDGYGLVPTMTGVQVSDSTLSEGAAADPATALAYLKRFLQEHSAGGGDNGGGDSGTGARSG